MYKGKILDLCSIKCIHEKKVRQVMELMPSPSRVNDMAVVFKALSDPTRLKIVLSLRHMELCVCDIAAICGQSDSAVSHQLRILRTQKILRNRRDGKIMYYTLDDDHVGLLIRLSLEHIDHG